MEISPRDLWAGFFEWCGERAPTEDLMLAYARARVGHSAAAELRAGTIVAILRTQLACNRHFATRDASRDFSRQVRAHSLRSALTLGQLAKEIVDLPND